MSIRSIASLLDVEPVSSGTRLGSAAPDSTEGPRSEPQVTLRLRVVWGDLVQVPADIHVAGHYQGVLPASAEQALDEVISAARRPSADRQGRPRGIIAEHTRRRWLVGELGEVTYFPGRDPALEPGSTVRRVAVAGMGRLGTFNEVRAEQLYASLLRELGSLVDVREAAMTLIGSGAGNLSVAAAARALYRGFAQVVALAREDFGLTDLAIVESDRLRAEQLVAALQDHARESLVLPVVPRVQHDRGGRVNLESAAVFALRGLACALQRSGEGVTVSSAQRDSLLTALGQALPEGLRETVPEQLQHIRPDDLQALAVVVGQQDTTGDTPPTRISVSLAKDRMRWAALTERSTIPEREVPVKAKLVGDLVDRLTAPRQADAERLPGMLRRWVVPEDFQQHIDDTAPLVLEVDGPAAQLPWEFLTDRLFDEGEKAHPLALRTPIARQLRTTYSRAVADYAEPTRLRALVVADPGPPGKRLPHARQEGKALAELLRQRDVDVTLLVGAPGDPPTEGAAVATELDVLTELLVGRYDIVHFAGHGTMPDSDNPSLAGWLFSDGLLSARDLAQMTWAPRLVTANACWTASGAGRAAPPDAPQAGEVHADATALRARARMTAVLADEFLRVGVAHYIGTSWAIPDGLGQQFALSFYERVLPSSGRAGAPFGEALRQSRHVLFGMRGTAGTVPPEVWSAWAAYQHYGDPADVLDAFV